MKHQETGRRFARLSLLVGFAISMFGVGVAHADTWDFTYVGSGYGSPSTDQVVQHNNPATAIGQLFGNFVDQDRVAVTGGYLEIMVGQVTGTFNLSGTYTLSGFNVKPPSGNRFLY
ncbi:MAG: hypothetical protein ACKO5K_12360, partial [Armatimonadota bacterium]